jgi:hypothetical protein
MRAVMWRELIVVTRRPALTVVICIHVGLLAGFVLLWNRGVPVLGGANLYEQQQLFQWVLLAVLLPWAAVRCAAPDRGDRFVMACAATALRPSSMIIAKVVALVGALALIVFAGFPAAIIAQQMSAVPLSVTLWDLISSFGLTVLVAAGTLTWVFAVQGRLAAWVGASGSTGLVLIVLSRWARNGLPIGLVAALIGAALVAAMATWSDGSLRYCDE